MKTESSSAISDRAFKLTDVEIKEDVTDHLDPPNSAQKDMQSCIKSQKTIPKKKKTKVSTEPRVCRFDRLGNEIGQRKQKVTFIDEVTNKKLEVVHVVPSFKQHNILAVQKGSGHCT